jgi:hypothetical protein
MNPVTFNQVFTDFLRIPPPSGKNRLAGTPFQRAPLFDAAVEPTGQKWGEGASRELVLDEATGLFRLPFPVVRAAIRPPPAFCVGEYVTAKVVLFQGPCPKDDKPVNWLWAELLFPGTARSVRCYFLQVWFRALPYQPDDGPDGAISFEAGPSFFNVARRWQNLTVELESKRLARLSEHIMLLSAAFLFDVNSPANHVARISPQPAGRSVEWLAAREHYVILDRRHEANKATLAKGATVEADAGRTLDRVAHSRRAHWRHFESDKFKAAKGTRKWIKSIWIGPAEWQDQGGSIYRLVR